MQYSSNSNAAIRSIIRSCPTPAGQYRQAMLQARDRRNALEDYQLSRKKMELQIQRKEAEIQVKEDEAKHLIRLQCPQCQREVLAADIALLGLEIQQIKNEMNRSDQLVEDAARELAVCSMEVERICAESGIDFAQIESADFQELMDDDHRVKLVRWAAARSLSSAVGCDLEFAEMLLELPEGDRAQFLMECNDLVLPMLPMPSDAEMLEDSYEQA